MVKCRYFKNKKVPISCGPFDGKISLDNERFNIILLKSGNLSLKIDGKLCVVGGQSVVCLSKPTRYEIQYADISDAVLFSFAPKYVNFHLNWKTILALNYKDIHKELFYPKFSIFLNHHENYVGAFGLDNDTFVKMVEHLDAIKHQIDKQPDQIWSCRSRLYMRRILRALENARPKPPSKSQKPLMVLQAMCYIENHINEKLTIEILCKELATNRTTLNYLFKKSENMPVGKYIEKQRLDLACKILGDGRLSVSEIAEKVGFQRHSNFIEFFTKKVGISPNKYRQRIFDTRNAAEAQSQHADENTSAFIA